MGDSDLNARQRRLLAQAYADPTVWFDSYPDAMTGDMVVTVHSRHEPRHCVTVTDRPVLATALAYQKYQETKP